MRYSYGPSRTTFYERRKKQLGINDSRPSLIPPPVTYSYIVTQAGDNLVTQAGDKLITQN